MTVPAKLVKTRRLTALLFRSLVVTLVGLYFSSTAFAQERVQKEASEPSQLECAAAHQDAQIERNLGNLLAAQSELTKCLHLACDPLIRSACGELLGEVEAALPSIVLAATVDGQDLLLVTVDDGTRTLTQRLDGVPLPVNPGPLRLTFRANGMVEQTLTLVVRTGVQNRAVSVQMERDPSASDEAHASPKVSPAQGAPPGSVTTRREATPWEQEEPGLETSEASRARARLSWVGLSLLGSGVALGAGGAALSLSALSDYKAAKQECAPRCSESVTDGIMARAWVGNALLGVSIVAIAVGVHQLVKSTEEAPSEKHARDVRSRAYRPQLFIGATSASIRGTF